MYVYNNICLLQGNMEEDSWLWHMYDTVKGSDWLGDQVKYNIVGFISVPLKSKLKPSFGNGLSFGQNRNFLHFYA